MSEVGLKLVSGVRFQVSGTARISEVGLGADHILKYMMI